MTERPILFSGPMVRALLDGTKTQTRRVVKHKWPQLWQEPYYPTGKVISDLPTQPGAFMEFRFRQQDQPGYDGSPASTLVSCPYGKRGDRLWVREAWADCETHVRYYATDDVLPIRRKRPSIHMPRWASRITLEVTGVRVERLNDISEADAQAEGVYTDPACPAYDGYRDLWESINGPGSWDANPWVWVVEFKMVQP